MCLQWRLADGVTKNGRQEVADNLKQHGQVGLGFEATMFLWSIVVQQHTLCRMRHTSENSTPLESCARPAQKLALPCSSGSR